YLNEHVPKTSLIATCEAELAVESDHNYHNLVASTLIFLPATGISTVSSPDTQHSVHDKIPAEYIIIGPFAKGRNVFTPENLMGYAKLDSIGIYDIYQWKGSAQ